MLDDIQETQSAKFRLYWETIDQQYILKKKIWRKKGKAGGESR